jgi:hypothetical protein
VERVLRRAPVRDAKEIGERLVADFRPEYDEGGHRRGAHRLHPVQVDGHPGARVIRLLPLEVVEGEAPSTRTMTVLPLYAFEPSADEVLDALLPKYVTHRIYTCLLQSAASELAARQRAMKSATDNADELIKNLHPAGQPGPPGRDHPRDQRNRRRRQTPSPSPPSQARERHHDCH